MERSPLQVYELDRPIVRLGRVEGMEIVIDNVSVLREQAEIRQEGRHWTVRDPGSSNGTFLNGERLTAAQRLKPGDEISFGKFSLFFERECTAPIAPTSITPDLGPARPPGTYSLSAEEVARLQQKIAAERQARIEWEIAGIRGTHHIRSDSTLVGRAAECDLRVPAGPERDIVVVRSERGFEVRNRAAWYRFVRMKVNGKVTGRALLHDGDRIEIGRLHLTFRDAI